MSWEGKKVLVLGAGESGLAMVRHLAGARASLRVADTRDNPPGAQAIIEAAPQAELAWGPFSAALFEGVDAVAVSPGVPVSGPLADPAVIEARSRMLGEGAEAIKLPFIGDIELFALALADEKAASGYAPKVLAITGTNGKTTVTALTTFLANRAGKRATAAGNISPAALDAWHAAKDAGTLPDIWVLELSSYQLETTSSLHPDAAVMLNLSEDHLDRHGSLQEYAAAKSRIFAGGGLQILNRDDPASLAMRRPFVPKGKKDAPPIVVTFGSSEPQAEHEWGLMKEARPGGLTWLAEGTEDGAKRLMPVEVLRIKGLHNALNALAALALNRSIGVSLAPMLKGLADYAGEAHRVQPVAEMAGVTYIDDSKGTNVGATLAALNGLGSELRDGRKLVLIAGGDGKGQNFEPLALPVAVYCRAVMLIGRDAPALEQALGEAGVPMSRCEDLPQAVRAAARAAQPGDLVLLSPACASLDMFRNYAHRAQVFVETVRELGREPAAEEVAENAPEETMAESAQQEAGDARNIDAVAAEFPAAEAMVGQGAFDEGAVSEPGAEAMVEAQADEVTPAQEEVAAAEPVAQVAEAPVEVPAEHVVDAPIVASVAAEQVIAVPEQGEASAADQAQQPSSLVAQAAAYADAPAEPVSPPSHIGEEVNVAPVPTGEAMPAAPVEPASVDGETTADVHHQPQPASEPAASVPAAPGVDEADQEKTEEQAEEEKKDETKPEQPHPGAEPGEHPEGGTHG
jgi:UDP-N-acetylmuramoylalanine--D-glutamate ligase